MSKRRSILYVQYTNPAGYPPLEHSSRILADDGWDVTFLGTGSHGSNELRFPPHPKIHVKLIPFQQPGWRQKLHYFGYILWCLWWCLLNRPTAVYCSDHWSTPIGLILRFFRLRVIYHEHDSPGNSSNLFLRLIALFKHQLLPHCHCVIAPNKYRSASLIRRGARTSLTVWNCPTRMDVVPNRTTSEKPNTLWYHGSLSPTNLPVTAIQSLRHVQSPLPLHFAGYVTVGFQNYIHILLDTASREQVQKQVQYAGVFNRKELLLEAARFKIGLALLSTTAHEPMAGASNKVFDYLACGLVPIVPNTPEWTDLYVAAGVARSADPESPESIAEAIQWFIDHPEETRAMGERGRQRILTDWNYETQFAPVKQLLESLVR